MKAGTGFAIPSSHEDEHRYGGPGCCRAATLRTLAQPAGCTAILGESWAGFEVAQTSPSCSLMAGSGQDGRLDSDLSITLIAAVGASVLYSAPVFRRLAMEHEVADQIGLGSSRPVEFMLSKDQLGLSYPCGGPHSTTANLLIPGHTTDKICGGLAQLPAGKKACYRALRNRRLRPVGARVLSTRASRWCDRIGEQQLETLVALFGAG